MLRGPAREGLALLQGMLLCGHCGRALTVRYMGNGGIYPCYLCNRLRRDGLAHKDCVNFRCDLLDHAVAEEVLKALEPAQLELALAALAGLSQKRRCFAHAAGILSACGALSALDERSEGIQRPNSNVSTQACCSRVRSGASNTVAGRPRCFARTRTKVASIPDRVFIMLRADC